MLAQYLLYNGISRRCSVSVQACGTVHGHGGGVGRGGGGGGQRAARRARRRLHHSLQQRVTHCWRVRV